MNDANPDVLKISEMNEIFLLDAEDAVNMLESIKISEAKEADIKLYETTVHGMKSALASIGEKELSDFAYKLEQAGINHNLAVMTDETPAFIAALKSVIEKMSPIKKIIDVKIADADAAYLSEKLLELKAACEVCDKIAAKTVVNDLMLKKWPERIDEFLDDISVHVLHGDFEEAVKAIETAANLFDM